MFQSKSNKLLMSSTLALIILCSALAASHVRTVQGTTPVMPTLYATLGPDPFFGYYAGYHDIWYKIVPEWEKIGIDLDLYFQGDIYDNWYLIWEAPLGGQPPGSPPNHWDLTSMEWWIHPDGFLWQDAIMLSKYIPPAGANIQPYLREENDELYWKMQTVGFDDDVRKSYCWAWQEFLMHNPPVINWYYPHIYYFGGSYIKGFDFTVWWYDPTHLNISISDEARAKLSGDTINRLETDKTLVWGASEAWWSYLVQFVDSYTEEQYANLVWGSLYKSSLTTAGWNDVEAGKVPAPTEYTFIPWLASGDPVNLTATEVQDGDGEMVTPMMIPLRANVQWSDGHVFDAQDVKFSYDITLNPDALTTGWGDFAPVVKRVEYCDVNGDPVPSVGDPSYDPNKIRLVLHDPYVDLKLTLGNVWGVGIMPHHALSGITPTHLRGSTENKNFAAAKAIPQIGPFKYMDEGTPAGYSWISFERNPLFFGYGLGWGPHNIDRIIINYVPDAETRFADIQIHASDFGEYPVAPVEVFEDLIGEPDLTVQKRRYVAGNDVWINFNNPYLSNRYVRLALAYATPYDSIFAEILPSWGVVDPIPGTTYVLPWSVYTEPAAYGGETVSLYNTEITPYTYDLAIAQQYLDMWIYSQTGKDTPAEYNQGCVGDADFDGDVDLDDLYYWLDEWGNAPYTRAIDWWDRTWSEEVFGVAYPWDDDGDGVADISGGTVAPGNDIDPDFNNDGTVGAVDFDLWYAHWGDEYPFPGAW